MEIPSWKGHSYFTRLSEFRSTFTLCIAETFDVLTKNVLVSMWRYQLKTVSIRLVVAESYGFVLSCHWCTNCWDVVVYCKSEQSNDALRKGDGSYQTMFIIDILNLRSTGGVLKTFFFVQYNWLLICWTQYLLWIKRMNAHHSGVIATKFHVIRNSMFTMEWVTRTFQ